MTRNFLPPFRGAAYSHLRSPLACRSAVLSLGGARRKSSASTGSARTDYIHAPPQNFLAMLNPQMRGSRVKTFVVRPLLPLFRKASVIRSEEHPPELQSLMRISYAGFRLNQKLNN